MRTKQASRSRRRGMTMVELLIAGLMASVLGAGLYTLIRSIYSSNFIVLDQNNVAANSRTAIDTFVDQLRGATGITSAGAGDITFTDTAHTYHYWRSGASLLRTVDGSPTGGTTVVKDAQTLAFRYGTCSGGTWTWASTSASPSTVGAVTISFTSAIATSNSSRMITSTVRLRLK